MIEKLIDWVANQDLESIIVSVTLGITLMTLVLCLLIICIGAVTSSPVYR